MAKTKRPKQWSSKVNLVRLDAATGHWRITTGATGDPLPRAVATDPGVRASVDAWIAAHRARSKPDAEGTEVLNTAIRTSVITAFRALPPAEPVAEPVVAAAAPRRG
jgi:hypothetical protein